MGRGSTFAFNNGSVKKLSSQLVYPEASSIDAFYFFFNSTQELSFKKLLRS